MKVRQIFSRQEYEAVLHRPVAPDLSPCWVDAVGFGRVSPCAFEITEATTKEWEALPWYWRQ
ncbi:hypothetical protein [uncultured Thiodictyon sp.]|jgi:hypothetical protein|uniref:hypothetical protein n=1 Tax=uncultured Thiodictyon sp. TaxID=1846217 RepID=UPI0025E5AF8A|nr:hypothetical protein [uncultured Thiodictyon sp.]